MDIPEGDIRFACTKYGAKAVREAAYGRMAGDRRALLAVGLADVETVAEADRIGQISYRAMSPAERDGVIAETAAMLGLLPYPQLVL
jgi:hypothetical protein